MNKEQFNEIKERLTKYREVRHLTYENQQAEFLGDVFEKVSKYFRAKDDLESVDALCYMAIFYINSFRFEYTTVTLYENLSKELFIVNLIYRLGDFIEKNKELDLEFIEINFGFVFLASIENIVSDLGFNFYKCMLQTIKEIESRTGHYDDELKKFVEKRGAYSVQDSADKFSKENIIDSDFYVLEDEDYFVVFNKEDDFALDRYVKWYKADYERCKL
ncbi:hypothetical protein [Campylobacter armoricus]|uniref:Uncharacterized protein n=1 Tax=Campylobacter armoricus TaxID=2505970 RepID=A0A7L5INT1_9BACT|nr:hypothetical protein [Campylobacter armoricus]QKF79529.1 hypothetical protein CARM_0611 [Campylobacter armoricus]